MATALFVKMEDIKRNSAISGSVDTDKFIQFVKIAQEVHILNYLGTDLYDKISADIIAGTLSGDYLNLTNDYVQPMLIHWALVEYLPFAAYTIANGGVYKHSSESSISVDKDEVDFLVEKERKVVSPASVSNVKTVGKPAIGGPWTLIDQVAGQHSRRIV